MSSTLFCICFLYTYCLQNIQTCKIFRPKISKKLTKYTDIQIIQRLPTPNNHCHTHSQRPKSPHTRRHARTHSHHPLYNTLQKPMSIIFRHVSIPRNEQLVCEYYDERYVLNGPLSTWLRPFTQYTRRSAVILENTEYAILKDEYTGELETIKGGIYSFSSCPSLFTFCFPSCPSLFHPKALEFISLR